MLSLTKMLKNYTNKSDRCYVVISDCNMSWNTSGSFYKKYQNVDGYVYVVNAVKGEWCRFFFFIESAVTAQEPESEQTQRSGQKANKCVYFNSSKIHYPRLLIYRQMKGNYWIKLLKNWIVTMTESLQTF